MLAYKWLWILQSSWVPAIHGLLKHWRKWKKTVRILIWGVPIWYMSVMGGNGGECSLNIVLLFIHTHLTNLKLPNVEFFLTIATWRYGLRKFYVSSLGSSEKCCLKRTWQYIPVCIMKLVCHDTLHTCSVRNLLVITKGTEYIFPHITEYYTWLWNTSININIM